MAEKAWSEQELRVIDAIQSAKDYLDEGDPSLALECLERIEPGDLSESAWGSLKKAKEEVEFGDPYIAGMVHLSNIASAIGYDLKSDDDDQQLPESISTDGSIAVFDGTADTAIAEFRFNEAEAKGIVRTVLSNYDQSHNPRDNEGTLLVKGRVDPAIVNHAAELIASQIPKHQVFWELGSRWNVAYGFIAEAYGRGLERVREAKKPEVANHG